MRKKYIKLQKLVKKGTLLPSHLEEHRDCDAIIADLLCWKNIALDNAKEWTADVNGPFKEFDCTGRCVIPRFTGKEYYKLLNYIIVTLLDTDRLEFIIYKNKVTIIITTKDTAQTLSAPTLALAVCGLFLERLKNEKT
jgi:hypothetical protein